MNLETLNCNNCGAPLQVPVTAQYVKCNHCDTQLTIRRTQSASFTERLDTIDDRTQEMQSKLERLERHAVVQSIDRAWEQEREKYLRTDKNGRRREPSEIGAVLGGVMCVGFGIFWTIQAAAMAGGAAAFGLLFIAVGVGVSIYGFAQAKDYRAAQRRYHRRRRQAMQGNSGLMFPSPPPAEQHDQSAP